MIELVTELFPTSEGLSRSTTKALEQVRSAQEAGVQAMVYVPHFARDNSSTYGDALLNQVEEFQATLQQQAIQMEILAGHTLSLREDLLEDLNKGQALSLNQSSYVLTEFDHETSFRKAEKAVYAFSIEGYIPIILRPEQHPVFLKDPDLLYRLIKRGALALVDAGSLAGGNGKAVRKFAERLAENHLVHCVSTFSERVEDRTRLYARIEKPAASARFQILEQNTENVVRGNAIHIEQPQHLLKKRFSFF
ncbi:CpsB/CapC family capsule biosynthesis tyrosine phosphatase [Shouchella shacheensis]|uniref:CpsB/CapC family capsule biosynthesis tyrosine phosphatase n=1 Tax=Shouchella shacheensis TaxID=1649580 RepID=UPI00073FCC64|nr:CpsB/CapC family capsule biosynthesis tyrosine phosphatase [Shouchella shacheensis]